METLAPTPANADNTAQANPTEADAKVEQAEGDGSAPSVPEADTPAPKKDAVQERIDKLTRDKYDALRERDRESYQREALEARLAALESAKPPETATQTDFPTLEQFGYDEGKYQAAIAQHFSKLAEEQGTKAAQKAFQEEQQRQQQEQSQKTWAQKEAEFKKSKPDYEEKALRHPRDGGPIITPSMAQIIKETGNPEVAYYLGENVPVSAAIAQMPPLAQAREIGRIEAKLELAKATPKPAVSQAPPPPSKIETDDAPTTVRVDAPDSDKLSDQEWTRRRNAQEAARKKRG